MDANVNYLEYQIPTNALEWIAAVMLAGQIPTLKHFSATSAWVKPLISS
jgi:hypothetical protein